MPDVYFKHKQTGTRFKLVHINKTDGTVTLQGDYGRFVEKYDKELFAKLGYELEKSQEDECLSNQDHGATAH